MHTDKAIAYLKVVSSHHRGEAHYWGVFGSRVLWNDLLADSLVNELDFLIGNIILGDGTPMFVEALEDRFR